MAAQPVIPGLVPGTRVSADPAIGRWGMYGDDGMGRLRGVWGLGDNPGLGRRLTAYRDLARDCAVARSVAAVDGADLSMVCSWLNFWPAPIGKCREEGGAAGCPAADGPLPFRRPRA